MSEAAVDAELAVSVDLEVFAKLRLVVGVQHANKLLAWESLRQGLIQSIDQDYLHRSCFSSHQIRERSCTSCPAGSCRCAHSAGRSPSCILSRGSCSRL